MREIEDAGVPFVPPEKAARIGEFSNRTIHDESDRTSFANALMLARRRFVRELLRRDRGTFIIRDPTTGVQMIRAERNGVLATAQEPTAVAPVRPGVRRRGRGDRVYRKRWGPLRRAIAAALDDGNWHTNAEIIAVVGPQVPVALAIAQGRIGYTHLDLAQQEARGRPIVVPQRLWNLQRNQRQILVETRKVGKTREWRATPLFLEAARSLLDAPDPD